MPTDRLVTINIQGIGDYDAAGIYIPGADMFVRRWATLVDTSLERSLTLGQGGARAEEQALYRTRYFKELAGADVRIVFLIEDDGDRYRVTRITEVTGRDGNTRRRWLEVDCIRADPGTVVPVPTEADTMADMMDMPDMMGGLMAAPTFTELASVTQGGVADDDISFASQQAAVNTAWNSGSYWAFLLDIQQPEAGSIEHQATALIIIRKPVTAALRAYFAMNITSAKSDRGYLHLASGTARIHFDDVSVPASSVVKLYGVS